MRKFTFVLLVIFFSCSEKHEPISGIPEIYFPPVSGNTWESISPSSLGWNISEIGNLKTLLEDNGTRAFILLKDGKIVMEEYFGTRLSGSQAFDQNSIWYWASAGKTLTATLIGIAQEEGKLNIQQPSSDYLGKGWTSLTASQEHEISVWHQLTMTTGLDDGAGNLDDFSSENLRFLAEPGTRWAYHNAPYTLLDKVIEGSTGSTFPQFFKDKLASKIGMTGSWQRVNFNNVFFSDARSMARFGLLILANGDWDGVSVIKDKSYLAQMLSKSQNLNQGYGYLWWLNDSDTFMIPQVTVQLPGSYAPNAPADMVCGLGRDGQYVCIIPSQNLVLVRMGSNPDQALVPFMFLNDMWQILRNIIPSA
ncbi:serine hydrolase domain-containing protein [Aquiflexum lacus]|uniref:serine hydrolase domain-containing protein n=1 Tax=Aquiflexum lacus TaxID=2483805 RepID=UPI001894AFFF|nr:serine hydrolase domain-containing protein [Aquiflexum lacus]